MNEPDVDSEPGNENGMTPDPNNDDTADTFGGDDYDPETITVRQRFDLALTKVFSSFNDNNNDGEVSPGDSVTYNITVYNQGSLDATNVQVADYISPEMLYNVADPINVANGWQADTTTTVALVPAGEMAFIQIRLQIDNAYMGTSIINNAEIVAATGGTDEDSTPGDNAGDPAELATDNDVSDESNGGVDNPFDSDDYDPCLLYTSPSPRDRQKSRMPSSA